MFPDLLFINRLKRHLCSNYNIVGYVTIGTMLLTVVMMYFIDQQVSAKTACRSCLIA